MRMLNDQILAEQCYGDIDLILGGHDHDPCCKKQERRVTIIKSGNDFEEFSDITIKFNIDTREHEVIHKRVLITKEY